MQMQSFPARAPQACTQARPCSAGLSFTSPSSIPDTLDMTARICTACLHACCD
jgi:hypothetical protein